MEIFIDFFVRLEGVERSLLRAADCGIISHEEKDGLLKDVRGMLSTMKNPESNGSCGENYI